MKRAYKPREMFTIKCRECNTDVTTNSYAACMCKSCAVYMEFKKNRENFKWRLKKLYAAAKFRSKLKNLPIDITPDYLVSLWEQSNGRCVVTGRSFDLASTGVKGQVSPNAPSIDRIIPANGYVVGNIRLITYHANVSISEFGLDSLKLLAKDILKFI